MIYQRACLKALIEQIIFLQFCDDEQLDPDAAVKAIENIAAHFSALDPREKKRLRTDIRHCAKDYQGELVTFVTEIPSSLGLEGES